MGNFTRLLYNANLKFASVFSVKFTNNEIRKNENTDCKTKTPINPSAIVFALAVSLFLTQSTSQPINLGKARAVALVSNKKINPR